jgi:hypothetical protein
MVQGISFSLFALACMITTGGSVTQEDRQKAMTLWDQAITAKGGRDRLAGISSFAIQEKTVFRRPLPGMAVGKVDQIVCELPDAWWEFLDYRPGQMGYSVRVVNARTGLGWASHGGPAEPLLRPDRDTAYRLRQLQYVYFLQTRWVQPTPLRASRVQLGSSPANRVEAEIDGETVVFYLDVDTHLPMRIETVRALVLKDRPGVPPGRTAERRYTFELDGYHEVAGIQVPARVTLGGDPSEVRVEINPDYDRSIFTRPPSPDATTDSWRKRADRK